MKKNLKNATMGNRWKDEISCAVLTIFRPYNGIDVLKLPFLEELYEKAFIVPYAQYVFNNLGKNDASKINIFLFTYYY